MKLVKGERLEDHWPVRLREVLVLPWQIRPHKKPNPPDCLLLR